MSFTETLNVTGYRYSYFDYAPDLAQNGKNVAGLVTNLETRKSLHWRPFGDQFLGEMETVWRPF